MLGPKRKFLALAMYNSCLFVSVSFAFGGQHEPSFQWNMGFKVHSLTDIIIKFRESSFVIFEKDPEFSKV